MDFRRFRPFRTDPMVRDLHAEVGLAAGDFILPLFVVEGQGIKKEIPTLTDVFHLSIDRLVEQAGRVLDRGIDKVLLFGVIDKGLKDESASQAVRSDGLVPRAVSALKKVWPKLTVMTDVCVCGYTSHGHCGLLSGREVLNDETLPVLGGMALAHASAGADFVAPSAMMDGQVGAIRQKLDEKGFHSTKILSYSAKFSSNLYGPFRDAADSTPAFGDRKTYQMDYRTRGQAIEEASSDIAEGADWIMVKPATFYLDVLNRIKTRFPDRPLAAYHVSGEYMMLRHGAASGLFSYREALRENLYALKRSGADFIITYAAMEAVNEL